MTIIGDDFQSIYGWCGSHPTFLMNVARSFPTTQAEQAGTVVLEENVRSRQPIIDAAEAVLAPISAARKVTTHGKSVFAGSERGLAHPVHLVEEALSWEEATPRGRNLAHLLVLCRQAPA